MPLYRYNGSLLRVAGGLAGHSRCCCSGSPGCCPDPPHTLQFLYSSVGACEIDGCGGTLTSDLGIPGCEQGWLQSTISDPFCLITGMRLCCADGVYTATVFIGLLMEPVVIPMTVVSCEPFELTGTVSATTTECTAELTLVITEP
jgi:hypothetical protein